MHPVQSSLSQTSASLSSSSSSSSEAPRGIQDSLPSHSSSSSSSINPAKRSRDELAQVTSKCFEEAGSGEKVVNPPPAKRMRVMQEMSVDRMDQEGLPEGESEANCLLVSRDFSSQENPKMTDISKIASASLEMLSSHGAIDSFATANRIEKNESSSSLEVPSEGRINYREDSRFKSYEGFLLKGIPHGCGKLTYANGSTFEGTFENGKRKDGFGKFTFANGNIKEGMWLNEKLHGPAKIIYTNGRSIEGNFVNGVLLNGTIIPPKNPHYIRYVGSLKGLKPHGPGKIFFTNGSTFEGTFEDGKETDGFGKVTCADGKIQEGMWVNHKLHGPSKVFYIDGGIVEGNFIHGVLPEGTIIYPKNFFCMRYEGSLNVAKPHGPGKMFFSNGSSFEGTFEDGKRKDGFGKFTSANGNIREGMWVNEKLHGLAKISCTNGWSIEGNFINGVLLNGTIIPSKSCQFMRYEGHLKDFKPQGDGKMFFASGSIFEGTFEDGFPLGRGKMTELNGNTTEGTWNLVNGVLECEVISVYPKKSKIKSMKKFYEKGNYVKGIIIYQDNHRYKRYEGSLKGTIPHGLGKMIVADGSIYEGNWVDGEACGEGNQLFPHGVRLEGIFKEGLLSEGRIDYPLDLDFLYDSYEGSLKNGLEHGFGTRVYSDGSIYRGEFKRGVPHGNGTIFDPDGSIEFEGELIPGFYFDASSDSKKSGA